jgi:hypothetical protein
MGRTLRAVVVCLLAAAAGCTAGDACPSFAHIVGGDFGRSGTTLWWTMQVGQLTTVTFNQASVPTDFLEYRWAIDVDSDLDGQVDLRAAIEHFVVMNAAPVTTSDILSQTTDDLLQVMGPVASRVGTFKASFDPDTNTFRFETTTPAAPGLANVTDGGQSSWKTVYRYGADPEDQCDETWP